MVEGAAEPPVGGYEVEKFLARNIDASPLAMSLEREMDCYSEQEMSMI